LAISLQHTKIVMDCSGVVYSITHMYISNTLCIYTDIKAHTNTYNMINIWIVV
jgi:hypothetical protein